MLMVKSNGGSGYVRDCAFTNFIGHSTAYALDINAYWTQRKLDSGTGVKYSNLSFANWTGTVIDSKRPAIYLVCPDTEPCTGIEVKDVSFWTDDGRPMKYLCQSAYGTGYCLKPASAGGAGAKYTTTVTVASAPTGFKGPKMAGDLSAGLGISRSIAVPTAIPTSFFPGTAAKKALLNGSGAGPS